MKRVADFLAPRPWLALNLTCSIDRFRVTDGPLRSSADDGRNGAFRIPTGCVGLENTALNIIASDGSGWDLPGQPWEHVSVSLQHRDPSWREMDLVRRLWWRDDETVLQFHVPRDRHINHHPFCLHLWRPTRSTIELPPSICVGPQPEKTAATKT